MTATIDQMDRNRRIRVMCKYENEIEPLLHRYSGKFALMIGFQYIGVFASERSALKAGMRRSPRGDFRAFMIA